MQSFTLPSCWRWQNLMMGGSAIVLGTIACTFQASPTSGYQAYRHRARPELILGVDKITSRKAKLIRMGLLKMSPFFHHAHELGADHPAALELFGQPCPAPDPARLSQRIPPSTALMPEIDSVPEGVTTVSIVCASEDLFDPVKGIVIHPEPTGRTSERLAWMSARLGQEMLIESPVGLRIHGGHSRGAPQKSFTLVFREDYGGHSGHPKGLFFGEDAPAARQFILINAGHPSRFNGALATEVSTLMGCKTSSLTPAVVYLNGTRIKTPYFIYQQQSPEFVAKRFGAADPDWVMLKASKPFESDEFIAWRRWYRKYPAPLSMHQSAKRFDLEDLSAWALAMAFTSTTDNNQGAYFRDRDGSDGRWKSLVWDMDCAFNDDTHRTDDGPIDYSVDPFAALLGYRAELFLRLFNESAEYREYFAQFARHRLENVVTKGKLMAMADRYIALASTQTSSDSPVTRTMHDTKSFLSTRHQTFWDYLERKIDEAEASSVSRAIIGAALPVK